MSFVELLLGWGIVAMLAIGSIVAADPFWGRRRAKPIGTGPRRASRSQRHPSTGLARRKPHRHLPVRARPDRRLPARIAGELVLGHAREQLLERDARLEPRQARAQAEVGAVPEAEVARRRARDVERVRVRELALVAVRGAPRPGAPSRPSESCGRAASRRSSRAAAAPARATRSAASPRSRSGSRPGRARAARAAPGAPRAARRRSRSGWWWCRCPRRSA